jgi:hypothetical protein
MGLVTRFMTRRARDPVEEPVDARGPSMEFQA